VSKSPFTEPAGGPRHAPLFIVLSMGLAIAAAIGLTLAAYRFPENAVLPTLAFFAWAYLFAGAAVALPGELGLFPGGDDDLTGTESDAGSDGSPSSGDSSEIYRIDE
jgi:hypothetical protein